MSELPNLMVDRRFITKYHGPSNIINNGLVSMLNMFQLAIISVGAVAIPCCKYHWTIFEHKVRARDEGGVDKRY